jgi:hypothetical protein
MVTALASARANVSDMYFVVPPTSLANTEASVRGQLLPELLDRKCDSATQLDATFSLGRDNTEAITYQPSNIEISHLYSEGGLPKIDGVGTLIMPGESHFIAQLQELLKQKTTNQMFYYVDIRTHKRNVSIAQLYDTLSRLGSEIFRLVASSPDNHHYPLQCSNQIRDYFQKAFGKAALMLISDDPHGELFIFKLNAQVERTEEGQWAVKFVSFTQPIVMAADPSITDVMAQSWKAASQPDPRKIRSLDATDSFHAWLPDVDIPPGSPDTWPRLNALIQSKHAQSDILASTNSVTKKDAELART